MNQSTYKIITLVLLMFFSSTVLAASPDRAQIDASLDGLKQSINSHDFGQVEPLLADAFTYQGQNPAMSRMIMQQVVAGYPRQIGEIRVLGISPQENGWSVSVMLESDAEPDQRTVRMSADYKILQADVADIQLGGHGQTTAKPVAPVAGSEVLPAVTTIPFVRIQKLIGVRAEVNGMSGMFLVDSGAQAMVLNSARIEPKKVQTRELDHAVPSGAGGALTDVKGATGLTLKWADIEMSGLRAMVTDLTHLEENLGGQKLLGLIGYNALEAFEVHFDYAANELTLQALNSEGVVQGVVDIAEPDLTIDFETAGFLPLIPVEVAGQTLRMGLDTGAERGMIFTRFRDSLEGQYQFIKNDVLKGADRNAQSGDVVSVAAVKVEDVSYAGMTFRFNDLQGHAGILTKMDGLLGYDFLSRYRTAINFRAGTLKVWTADRAAGAVVANTR